MNTLIDKYNPTKGKVIIFCETKAKVNALYTSFKRNDV